MLIVDTALAQREEAGRPVRVAIIGAGYMGRSMVRVITKYVPGMTVVGLYNRTLAKAAKTWADLDVEAREVKSAGELEDAARAGVPTYTGDPMVLCRAEGVDVVVEATGEVEFGTRVAVEAIEHGKHLVLMNAEVDAVVGPILKVWADRKGVVVTNVDGDQPGVIMNLFRWVKTIGYHPVLAGNIKGMLDHRRNPDTQRGFAEKWEQGVKMITSFADGTKLACEMVVVANATGFRVAKRGMHGPPAEHVSEALGKFDLDGLQDGGIVDYILGAEPGPGVFVIGYNEDPVLRQVGQVLKMGEGPFYTFYVPYHLPHLEAPLTAARAALFQDAATAPIGAPVAEVLTAAKVDLKAGTRLDGIGGFHCYGIIDNVDVARGKRLLPMNLSEGCVLTCDVAKDAIVRYDDVRLPSRRFVDDVRRRQDEHFFGDSPLRHAAATHASDRATTG